MRNLVLAIDIGTSNIYVILMRFINNRFQIISSLCRPSLGLRKGEIIEPLETVNALNRVLNEIESTSGLQLARVPSLVAVSGIRLESHLSKGMVVVSRPDGQITAEDLHRVLEISQTNLGPNRVLVNTVPLSYFVDGNLVTDPLGLRGAKLEVQSLVFDVLSSFLTNLEKVLEGAELSINQLIAGPLATSWAVLTKEDREEGVLSLDLGAQTTTLAVFEEDKCLYSRVLPVGAHYISQDIAIWLKCHTDLAEKIKIGDGVAWSKKVSKKETINLEKYAAIETNTISRYELAEVIEARLEQIFGLVLEELKQINKARLPRGVVLSGGGAKMPEIINLAKEVLRLPTRIGTNNFEGLAEGENPAFMKVLGLVLYYLDHLDAKMIAGDSFSAKLKRFFREMMP